MSDGPKKRNESHRGASELNGATLVCSVSASIGDSTLKTKPPIMKPISIDLLDRATASLEYSGQRCDTSTNV